MGEKVCERRLFRQHDSFVLTIPKTVVEERLKASEGQSIRFYWKGDRVVLVAGGGADGGEGMDKYEKALDRVMGSAKAGSGKRRGGQTRWSSSGSDDCRPSAPPSGPSPAHGSAGSGGIRRACAHACRQILRARRSDRMCKADDAAERPEPAGRSRPGAPGRAETRPDRGSRSVTPGGTLRNPDPGARQPGRTVRNGPTKRATTERACLQAITRGTPPCPVPAHPGTIIA